MPDHKTERDRKEGDGQRSDRSLERQISGERENADPAAVEFSGDPAHDPSADDQSQNEAQSGKKI